MVCALAFILLTHKCFKQSFGEVLGCYLLRLSKRNEYEELLSHGLEMAPSGFFFTVFLAFLLNWRILQY